jgi:hypothetical protein
MRDEFMITRQGKKFVLYAGLLDEAHSRGLRSIETDLVQVPSEENGGVAIAKAIVRTEEGKFSGIGDADDSNVGRNIVPHKIRMAETRAKARALRDAINVNVTAFEELGGDDEPVDEAKALLIRIVGKRRKEYEGQYGEIEKMSDEKANSEVERLLSNKRSSNA